MRKIYKRLTQDQINRGVIFSSSLSKKKESEDYDGIIHEVFKTDMDATEKIKRLLNDKFFNDTSYKYNIIREG